MESVKKNTSKIVLWCNRAPNQIALANKIASDFSLVAIVFEKPKLKKKLTALQIFRKIVGKILYRKVDAAWFKLMDYYSIGQQLPEGISYIEVPNINDTEALEFTNKLYPEIVMVSGTTIVSEEIIKKTNTVIGIINLHTGLSPYVKGGPNCTNWCLANNEFHLIGNTVMWIDKGIDSGNIIASEFVDFTGDEDLFEIHRKVMEHAHMLSLKAVRVILQSLPDCKAVKQSDIEKGKLYLSRMWGNPQKRKLLKHLKHFNQSINSESFKKNRSSVSTFRI